MKNEMLRKAVGLAGKVFRVEVEPFEIAAGRNFEAITSTEEEISNILQGIRYGDIGQEKLNKLDYAYSKYIEQRTNGIPRDRKIIIFDRQTLNLPPLIS